MLEQDEAMHDSVKPMSLRVLFVGKAHLSHVGGAEMSTRYLAAALARRGNHVGLLASVKRRSIQGLFDQVVVTSTRRVLEHSASDMGCVTTSSIRPLRTLRGSAAGNSARCRGRDGDRSRLRGRRASRMCRPPDDPLCEGGCSRARGPRGAGRPRGDQFRIHGRSDRCARGGRDVPTVRLPAGAISARIHEGEGAVREPGPARRVSISRWTSPKSPRHPVRLQPQLAHRRCGPEGSPTKSSKAWEHRDPKGDHEPADVVP